MRNVELYKKYKTHYPPVENLFSRENWWQTVLIAIGTVLVEPLIMYKKYRRVIPFSRDFYFHQIEYFLMIMIPIGIIYVWLNWRQSVKRKRGYCWVGKFEVVDKCESLAFCYFRLSPGTDNKVKVSRKLFSKTRVGDHVVVRRDALGHLEEVSKIKKFATRLSGARALRF